MKGSKAVYIRSIVLLSAIVAMVATGGCSLKKNTAASRQYSAFITRYNIYYNGDTHYKETLAEMEKSYEDDYSRLLFVHPAEARADEKAPQPSGDFTRSIEKAQKAIQLRSIKKKPARKPGQNSDPAYKEWLKREEYNPFLHNAWMMMGRSQFNNGDFLGAASTFFYVSKHFKWLPETVLEAEIWQARSYCSLDWLFEAETILRRILPSQVEENKSIRHLYNLTYADFYIKSKEYDKSVPYLREAISTSSGAQKVRLNFLLGQVLQREGDTEGAYAAFKAAGSSGAATYRTKFNARIKQSEVYTGDNIEPEVNALRRMARLDRNNEYLDQIYYAIGNLYLSRRDTTQAIENYQLAVQKSKRSGIDKALAQLTLGGLYYERGNYVAAQPCYSEAIPQIPDTYPDYKTLRRRSDYLDELAVYASNVELQDSLLTLSYLTPEEQQAVAERLIEELKKKEAEEAEEARRAEMRAEAAGQDNPFGQQNSPTTYTMNNDNSWYFYNQSTVTAGKTEFQRRWGSRKLEDDWRRRNKASFAFDLSGGDEDEDSEGDETQSEDENGEESADTQASEHENDPHYVEYYLKQIPHDDHERAIANDVIQEGLYNMGVILKDKLEDFPASEKEFNRLLERYPDNIYRLDTYYNLYLMYVRSGDTAMAERYRLLIVNDFPDSKYGRAMVDPNYIENLRAMDRRQHELYDQAYEAYLDNDNSRLRAVYEEASHDYPMSPILPKFMFLNALSYVTENRPDDFKGALTELLERYPDTDLTPYASAYLKGLNEGRKLHAGGSNMRGMLWDIKLGGDSTGMSGDTAPEFELNAEAPQMLVLLYPTDKVSANQLLYDIARHNFTSFVVKDFDLEQMNFGRLGLLIIKPFESLKELNHYRSIMAADEALKLPDDVIPVVISVQNFETLLSRGGSFDDYFRFAADKTYRDTEERVLPPELFGNSYGIVDEEPENEMEEREEREDGEGEREREMAAPTTTEATAAPAAEEVTPAAEAPIPTATEAPSEAVTAPTSPEASTVPTAVEAPAVEAPTTPTAPDAPAVAPTAPATPTPTAPDTPAVAPAAPATPTPTAPATPTPTAPAVPAVAKPAVPDYPIGSEGDDPLLD